MSRLEQRLTRLETLTSPAESKDSPKIFHVEKLSAEEWGEFIHHREDYELAPLPDQKANSRAVRMKFMEIK